VINFAADQSNAESVSPTVKAILSITASGSGRPVSIPLLTVKAKDAGTGTASNILSADYAAFGPAR
jgi:hypothetical protein